ncbi:MAG TPA: crossover junction endodeoxyribonuclease RuvC [Gordonia sp. (in: high G+C Gram-positive bacteria)]|uniref:crossover junction endodeoxyribonuclease RuvC n=1 Tax=unclassified Gordonia (in: high G+C Gram-positive bacteria) TaxID=2657482 RepID=UPI000F9B3EE8|nr:MULTISPECIES: crossover junction endodeoxyribonuclease RuvC [unclassified Gordonia (in: high G+C Gram-positive bacteria)]RUP35763.1 MAG: crossover junction endodeoxyribonuclease RuvC [Gordonia sp. (in: high G+C Gram-positive bacteria)]HNP57755.1 crossover junction endodeoxyribonuclease RuvC [Gordonia sp. (in: high G+C Gram-positive bacteria)]HRC50445.1 crossover junction endodeoxyribonuclease RuvC [Gordonia sp. (in: high G+C Gram-positive bacteria)]
MRVMGVDPGLTRCGIALVESGGGRSVTALDVDVVRTPASMDLADRLLLVYSAAVQWLETHRPQVVAVERVFAQQQVSTAMGTAQAAGVVALAAAQHDVPVRFHTPSEVKAAVTGSGRADKAQVTTMVTRILGMQTRPTPADAADALALAICQCWRGPMDDRLVAAQAKAEELARVHRARLKAAHAAAVRAGQ